MSRRLNCFLLKIAVFFLVLSILPGSVGPVQAAEKYPARAIDIIVTFAPGGSTDLTARVQAAYLSKKWGVPVNVINKPGGNTLPAVLEVYSAKPDGYTMLADGNPSSSMLGIVVKNLPIKVADRTFIAMTTICSQVVIVPPSSPANSMKDLAAEAKKDPNFTWASLGGAGLNDLCVRQFLKAIGIPVSKTRPVMAQGGSQLVTLTAGGNVKLTTASVPSCLPAVRAKTIKPLAMTGTERWPDLPSVPTTAEAGFPTITGAQWNGIAGPPNLPAHVVEAWNSALRDMVKDPDTIAKLKNIGAVPFYHNASEFKDYVVKETEEVRELWEAK